MFMAFFGGEGGISTDRVTGISLLGVAYSSSWQVYYLIVAWTVIATVLMRLQTQTPLGRMANATRDNFERAQFVGYDPRMVRFYQFALSGFFAGIGGGLYAIVYEIVTFDTVAAPKSATALLATYIGGAGGFFGPILGTILVVLLQSGVSLLERLAALCRRAVHRHGDVCARRAHRHHRPARADRPDRPAARARRALSPHPGAGLIVRLRLRPAGRAGVVHDHRRGAGQGLQDRRPRRRPRDRLSLAAGRGRPDRRRRCGCASRPAAFAPAGMR